MCAATPGRVTGGRLPPRAPTCAALRRVAGKGPRHAFEHGGVAPERVAAAGDRQRQRGVLLDLEHRDARPVGAGDRIPDASDENLRRAQWRLVRAYRPRPRHESACHCESTLYARSRATKTPRSPRRYAPICRFAPTDIDGKTRRTAGREARPRSMRSEVEKAVTRSSPR